MNVTIYHNPRCSKSRQTLQLLTEQGIEANIVEYLNAPPSADELKQILNSLDMKPRELMRKNESIYKESNLNDAGLSDEQLVAAMIEHPILIERPIVLANGKASIGRPPENVLEIL
jgi:arsenate reductase (glutaredoxin)